MAQVFLGVGSNEAPGANIKRVVSALRKMCGDVELSPCYLSPAVAPAVGVFANLVIGATTLLPPEAFVQELKKIENSCGRKPDRQTIDLDLLLYDSLILSSGLVRIPRDDIEQYAFVLKPLAVLAPAFIHPVTQRSIAEMWESSELDDAMLDEVHLEALEQ